MTCRRFGPVAVRRHPLLETCTTERYRKLLGTYAPIRCLDARARQDLLAGVGAVVEQFGGTVESRDEVVLYVARVRR